MYKGCPKKSETGSDAKKLPIAAVSQASVAESVIKTNKSQSISSVWFSLATLGLVWSLVCKQHRLCVCFQSSNQFGSGRLAELCPQDSFYKNASLSLVHTRE